jgi:hypothetical protein
MIRHTVTKKVVVCLCAFFIAPASVIVIAGLELLALLIKEVNGILPKYITNDSYAFNQEN